MSLINNTSNIFKKGVVGNVRQAQEDSHDIALQTPNGDVFVVCDGMGGHVGGAKASSLAVESILTRLNAERYDDPQMALNDALQFANMQILGFAAENPEYQGMGTTACIVLVQEDKAYIAHVGDSRIYLYLGKEKELHRITKDHSYVQTLVDAGQITDEEAEHHPNKNRILKALGVTPDLQPSFGTVKPKNGDIFLICTDGLCGMIPDSTIERVLKQKNSLEERGEMLIQLAMQGETVQPGGQDNCTLELIPIDNSRCKESEYTSYNPYKAEGEKVKKSSMKIIMVVAIMVAVISALGVAGVVLKKQLEHKAENEQINKTISDLDKEIDKLAADTLKLYEFINEIKERKLEQKLNPDSADSLINVNEKEKQKLVKQLNDKKRARTELTNKTNSKDNNESNNSRKK
jgi:protein phosphatase